MFKEFYHLITSAARLTQSPLPARLRFRIALDYLRLRLKNHFFAWRKSAPTEESVLGFQLRFFKYSTMVYLFEEIFVQQSYSFSSANRAPFILDAGANIGLSVLYLKTLFPDAKIVAFEPDPETFAVLKHNISTNQIKGVELRNQALLDFDGHVAFHTDPLVLGSPGMSTVPTRRAQNATSARQVPCIPLSWVLDRPIDFMKMDIEGAESLCLDEAARNGRLPQIRQMLIECHHNVGIDGGLRKVLDTLESNGFEFQVSAALKPPFPRNQAQDIHIYAYQP